ncbi:MAG: hypothetical protein ACOC0R_00125 [Mariniphaga sp.]
MKKIMIVPILLFLMVSCHDTEVDPPQRVVHEWNFPNDAMGWEGDFADYPVGREEFMELEFDYEPLPAPLDTTSGAIKLSGTNTSDDLFMFMKRRITGLQPGTVYNALFTVEFASNVPDDRVGIGGPPGESVWIKAGATDTEPEKEVDDMDYYRMNIDKGGQSQGGDDMIVLGDFSNDTDQQVYTLKTVTNDEQSFSVMPDDAGELWLIVGTDSGFEGNTTIYYNSIKVELFY